MCEALPQMYSCGIDDPIRGMELTVWSSTEAGHGANEVCNIVIRVLRKNSVGATTAGVNWDGAGTNENELSTKVFHFICDRRAGNNSSKT